MWGLGDRDGNCCLGYGFRVSVGYKLGDNRPPFSVRA